MEGVGGSIVCSIIIAGNFGEVFNLVNLVMITKSDIVYCMLAYGTKNFAKEPICQF